MALRMVSSEAPAQEQLGSRGEGETKIGVEVFMKGEGKEQEKKNEDEECFEYTIDGSVDIRGQPAAKGRTGGWVAGSLVLVNQGLATMAFFGVSVNLVLFLTRVLRQNNADAANNVSKWMGTVYMFSLFGAFLSDSYWGRYKTCTVFQVIFVLGLVMLSVSSHLFLLTPSGCGSEVIQCESHSSMEIGLFYLSIYLVALGNGGYQPNIATFGSDQFEEDDPKEAHSKVTFFSYFYLALNIGSLFSNTILCYFEDKGLWALGFWLSTGSAFLALILFVGGTYRYRHFRPSGNPMSRIGQVVVAASRKWRVKMPPAGDDLYELDGKELAAAGGSRKIFHTRGFKFLDRAATVCNEDFTVQEQSILRNPWRLCTITQVEEVKCVLRLLPIWLCTIIYSMVFTQMASLFVEQGAAMGSRIASFHIPAASMSAFDIISVAVFIFLNRRLIHPLAARLRNDPRGLTELQRMGVGLIIAVLAMAAAGIVEHFRLEQAYDNTSTLHILWQVPQYVLIGASEVFMYVGQLEFFNDQAPDGLKSFGSALCMTSISLGNFASYLIVTVVMKITETGSQFGWIPDNLNKGHMDRFFFLLGAMSAVDFAVYLFCAKWYQCIKLEGKCEGDALATGCYNSKH